MTWVSPLIAQNGNSSVTYRILTDPRVSVFDVVATGSEAGSSRVGVTSHFVVPGPAHDVTVQVADAAAVAFRIRGAVVP